MQMLPRASRSFKVYQISRSTMGTVSTIAQTKGPAHSFNSVKDGKTKTPLLPAGAFDTHVHVFDPSLGPYAPSRAYTPEDAPLSRLIAFNEHLTQDGQVGNLVLVQPSPYKTDCRVLLKCLRDLQARNINGRAIVVIDLDDVTDHALDEMHQLGARGIRLNFQADGREVNLTELAHLLYKASRRIQHLPGWMVQLYVPVWVWDALYDSILDLPVPVIADHVGGALGRSKLPPEFQESPLSQPGFSSLTSLARQGRVIVKISGLYRCSSNAVSTYGDMKPIIESLAREVPDQLVWGSDWPHTGDGAARLKNTDIDVKEGFRSIDNLGIYEV
ncbi:hypothetical protein ANOM_003312 [Aspergillus nomiae NRRL 13137]|uniref:Amidohydrolase-related domain-containing protein n=1 Tax=Aspergillus nomiae NRRL (strain ATCC 15546 / NRRL 13137 / CBS 260.88 / M93) TaxID=1509407 RepID=A0A0L1J9H3_ASPN3|nr:uncharacterized protein ANOM_003312 [Aspergillus nomiae NRRL 13137]KNG88382.1 hypothetical protein ANOM_003312 [Aspergillus nomiae NRRL 13137]